jgi:hypothetical protein
LVASLLNALAAAAGQKMLRQRREQGILEPLLGAADVSSADQGSAESVSRLWTAAAGFCTLAGVRTARVLCLLVS